MNVDTAEFKELLSPSLLEKMSNYQWANESCQQIIDKNDKQVLVYAGGSTPLLTCDRIIKLTWGHFLGIEQDEPSIYFYPDDPYHPFEIHLLATLKISGDITLDNVTSAFSEANPKEFDKLSTLLYKEETGKRYVSYYRHFEVVFGYDILCTFAYVRVLIDNSFDKVFLDVVGHLTKDHITMRDIIG